MNRQKSVITTKIIAISQNDWIAMMIMVLNSSVLVVHTQVPGYLTLKEAAQGLKTSSAGRTNHSKYEKRAICYDVCISVT